MRAITIMSILVFISCADKPQAERKVLRNGYAYEFYVNSEGSTPKVGEIVSIDFDIIDDFGNNLSDSRKANIRPTVQIPESMDATMKRNPLLSLIEVMSVGDSAMVLVPVDSLSSPPSEFLQSKEVRYVVVVRSIETQDDYMNRVGSEQQKIQTEAYDEAKQAFDSYMSGAWSDKVVEKNGGVKLVIINETNGIKAEHNELAMVHYYGFFKNGESFDNSFKLGKPYNMRIGRGGVIQGWQVAMPHISEGSTAIVEIPYQMAYGKEGKGNAIPPQSDLIFWIKIDRVEKSKKLENN